MHSARFWATAVGVWIAGMANASAEAPTFDQMFADHAVIQREAPIRVTGKARPRERVVVEMGATRQSARADAQGRFVATLPAMQAGGPHTLTVRGRTGESRTISDILIGDVFLCAGQSNMEWPVSASLSAGREIARATDASIRLMTIAHVSSPLPQAEFAEPVAWSPVSPDSVREFSATCYFFARDLRKTVDVPLGLIDASWGGSTIEAWTGENGLKSQGFGEHLQLLKLYASDRGRAVQQFGAMWETWWRSQGPSGLTPYSDNAAIAGEWRAVPEPMRDWKTWGVAELAQLNGMVWFRRELTLTAQQAAQSAELALGRIDEVDTTWVNGRAIGNTFGWSAPRNYDLPAGVLRAGANTIVVNVLSTWDAGGMYGPAPDMQLKFADGSSLGLGSDWRYQTVANNLGYPPRAPWESIGGLSTLYNAMIAPIGAFGVKGVLWYQGESNTGEPEAYDERLGGFMASLRAQFGARTPFLIAQLPNFGALVPAPAASGWASLRDAQRRAVAADARAALAVTIDLGDPNDLHPPGKQGVGARLARAARALVYGERIAPSGPRAISVERLDDGTIAVAFDDVEGALIALSAAGPIAFELCGADQASCRFARTRIEGRRVLVESDGAPAARVRHCWGDAPLCNLYDGSGLPAGPFEMEIRARD